MTDVAPESQGHDVFLSYSGPDRDAVEQIAERLVRDARLAPWFDRWSLTGGRSWPEEAGDALDAVDAVAVFVGPGDLGGWTRQEMFSALDRAAQEPRVRVFPVLLPGVPEPFDANILPRFLRTRTWVDFRSGAGSARGFDDLVNAIRGLPFGPPAALEPSGQACPYRGLEVFDERHADLFFGRDADVQRLLERLRRSRFLAVVGPSGSGKSSLVRAGLLPALRGGPLVGGVDRPALLVRPGERPLTELAAALAATWADRTVAAVLDELRSDPRTLDHVARVALAGHEPGERLVLCIDQLEEALLAGGDEEQRAFFANLVEAGSAPGGRALVILTLRADFYARLSAHPELAQLVSAYQYLVGPLDADGMRAAIEEPARRTGLRLEAGLTETIVREVGTEPGGLPLLEHALLVTWSRRHGSWLTLADYRAAGGVEGALTNAAEGVFGDLDEEEQAVARRLLLRLTRPGDGPDDARRRATLEELTPEPGRGDAVERVLHALAGARLVTSSAAGVEIAHEALIRGWPRLHAWIEEDREGHRLLSRLTAAANEWVADREPDRLYGAADLAAVRDWAIGHADDLSAREHEFLRASRSRAKRKRFFRVYGYLLLGVALITTTLAFIAFDQAREADRQGERARSKELAASGLGRLTTAPAEGLAQARRALDHADTREARAALSRSLSASYERDRLAGHRGRVTVASDGSALDRRGERLVTAGDDRSALVWNLATGTVAHRLGHRGKVTVATFSPDDGRVMTADHRGAVRIWDAAAGRLQRELDGHDGAVGVASFSPDGRRALTGGADGTARIWDVASGRAISVLEQRSPVRAAVFGPRRGQALVAGRGGATIWDVDARSRVRNLATGGAELTSADAHGRRIVAATSDRAVRFWGRRSGQATTRWLPEPAETVAFSPDGSHAVSTGGTSAHVWDVERAKPVALEGHGDFVNQAAFGPDGTTVVTASTDGIARVWDTGTARSLRELRGHSDAVTSALFTRDGRRVVTAADDGTARVWDTDLGTTLRGHSRWVVGVAFDSRGRRLATAGDEGTARIWDAATGREVRTVPFGLTGNWATTGVTFGDGDTLLAIAGGELYSSAGAALVVDARSGALRETLRMPGWTAAAAFSRDGETLATAGDDGARLWDVDSGTRGRWLARDTEGMNDVAFSQDGSRLVTAGVDGAAQVWDPATGHEVVRLRGSGSELHSAAFDPTGGAVVTTSSDRAARVWSVPSGGLLRELRGHESTVYDAAFSPDGNWVVTASNDGTTRVWSTRSGAELAVIRVHSSSVNTVAVSPDLRIATGSDDRTARVYRCRTCGTIGALRGLADRLLARTVR
jgi:WD40 repeat protein/energy-coupling factor transporter ATP-binding protein EcfA2